MNISVNGEIQIGNGVNVFVGMKKSDVLRVIGNYEVKEVLSNPPYNTQQMDIGDYVLAFHYNDDQLVEVMISYKQTGMSWGDWNHESLVNLKEIHDALIKKWLGSCNNNFDWGTVESVIDEKGGSASIIVKMK